MEPELLQKARALCVRAWRMRHRIEWGVRDWASLRFELDFGWPFWTLRIFGAYEGCPLQFYVSEQLRYPPRVRVLCVET